MQKDAFFNPTHCLNLNGAVCRVIKTLPRDEVIIEFINGMQSRVGTAEISKIKETSHGRTHRFN